LFELQGKPLAHEAVAVDRVYERFGVGFQDVAFCDFNHRRISGSNVPRLVKRSLPQAKSVVHRGGDLSH